MSWSSACWFMGNIVTYIVRAAEQHDYAVDARRDAAMGRGAEFQGTQHAAEFFFQNALVVTSDGEGLFHDLRLVVPDRT